MTIIKNIIILLFTWLLAINIEPVNSATTDGLQKELVEKYEELKEVTNCEFIITSGKRSVKRNRQTGGSKNSFHLYGMAMDIQPNETCSKTLRELTKEAFKLFNGVIMYPRHIHLDIGERIYHSYGGKY